MKRNFKKIIPLIGISTIGISAIISGAVLSINSVSKNNVSNTNVKVSDKLFSYSMSNLSDINILSNPVELSSYLYNYGALGMNSVNPVKSIDVISKKANANNCYNVDLRVNGTDGQNYVVENVDTSVPVANEISNLNFDRLNEYFLHFNEIINVYNSLYANNNALMNIITLYTNLTSDQISSVSINFSNNFNLGSTNTLSFELQIFLNSNYVYNGSNVISCILPTSIIIDWNSAAVNASKLFVFDDVGSITGITNLGLQNEVLIIPEWYITDNGDTVQVNSISSLLPKTPGDLSNIKAIILPNKIKSIGANAFGSNTAGNAYSNLKWINLPKSLSNIGNYAFENCTNLQNLSLYNQEFLGFIGNNAFANCRSFTNIYLNDKVFNLGNYAFSGCRNLTSVRLSNGLTSISDFLFLNCTSLKYLVLPYSISSIGQQAFRVCSSLSSINMPYSLKRVGNLAFQDASILSNIVFLDTGTVNQIQFGDSLFYKDPSNHNITNIYILGDFTNRNNFTGTFKISHVNYVKVYVTSERVFNLIANNKTGNVYLSKNHLFIMEKGNYPWVAVNNVDAFIKYWQPRINSYNVIAQLENNSYSQFIASVKSTHLVYWDGWVLKASVTKSLDSNGNVIAITFTVYLKNQQIFDVEVPLLNPIAVPSI